MATREGKFYGIWPVLDGKPLNLQWGQIRSNQAELKAIVRNSEQELEDGVDELNALRALLGQAYGDLDFRNKFRFFYESTTKELCCQKNDGTVDTPIWTDAWCVRFVDGQFQVVGQGGIQSEAGFYGPGLQSIEEVAESSTSADVSIRNPTKIFFNSDDGLSVQEISSGANQGQPEIRFSQPFGKAQQFSKAGKVWQVDHNFGVSPVMVQVMDGDDRVIIPDMVDVSNPNTAWFYFNEVFTGSVYIASGGLGAASLVPRDPFYLTVRHEGQPATPDNTFSPNVDMIFNSKYFYVNPDQDLDAGGAHPRVLLSLTDEATNPGVTLTDGDNTYFSAPDVNFNGDHFYLSSNLDGEPVVNLEPKALLIIEEADGNPSVADVEKIIVTNGTLTDDGDGQVTLSTGGTGTPTLTVTDGANTFTAVDQLNVSDADFYLSADLSGNPVVNLLGSAGSGGTDLTVTDGVNEYLTVAQINFNDGNFYLSSDAAGEPVVNFIPDASGTSYTHTQAVAAAEWVVNHATATSLVGAFAYDTSDRVIYPEEVDVSDPNTTYFYFTEAVAGKALIVSSGGLAAPSDHGALSGLTDDDHTQYVLADGTREVSGDLTVQKTVRAEAFYLESGGELSHASAISLRLGDDEHPALYWPDSPDPNFGFHMTASGVIDIGSDTAGTTVQISGTYVKIFDQLRLNASTVPSNPALSFINDTDTGIFQPTNGEIAFASNDIETMRIGTSGLNVAKQVQAAGFYLAPGSAGVGRSLNEDIISFDIPTAEVDNYWMENFVDQGFVIKDAVIITQSGSCTVGFYIHGDGERHPGVSITGLDPISASTTKATSVATAANVVNPGDSLVMSIPANTSATHVRGRLKIALSG